MENRQFGAVLFVHSINTEYPEHPGQAACPGRYTHRKEGEEQQPLMFHHAWLQDKRKVL